MHRWTFCVYGSLPVSLYRLKGLEASYLMRSRIIAYMRKFGSLISALAIAVLLALSLCGCAGGTAPAAPSSSVTASSYFAPAAIGDGSYAESHLVNEAYTPPAITIKADGEYTDKDSVALYIHTYGTVPSNYVTKTKARNAGWVNTEGNLWDVLPGKSIGGGGFYNDDGMMPDAPGREWFECDIDYGGGFRNAKRIVYSNDGLVYYTDDHYNTFQRLY